MPWHWWRGFSLARGAPRAKNLLWSVSLDPLTHMIAGALVAQSMAPEEHRWAFALVAAGAGVVPDVDFVSRKAKRGLLFLKLHRGFTHSLVATPIIAACAAGSGLALFGTPLWPLFAASLLAAMTHMVLDTVMHSTGLQVAWPWRRKLCLHLVVGLNPLTSSARCGERSLMVCLRCTMHSAVISPLVLLMGVGFGASLLLPQWALISRGTLAGAALYLSLCWLLRLRSRQLLARSVRQAGGHEAAAAAASARTFPASFSPAGWIGVTAHAGGFRVHSVNALSGAVALVAEHGPSDSSELAQQTRQTETVQEFLANAVFPHATVYPRPDDRKLVVWRDLAFAFSPVVSLFAARLELDQQRQVLSEEFRERWDRHPESI